MHVELSVEQFEGVVKEALDSMDDITYVAFLRRIASEATLRGLHVTVEVKDNMKGRRSRGRPSK